MSASEHDMPELTGDERIAAEYALGLLEGEDLLSTRGRMAREPGFAALVGQWEARLAPLLDEGVAGAPSPELWDRIAAELNEVAERESPVVLLQRRVAMWQRVAAGSAVAAVAALAMLFVPPGQAPGSVPLPDTPPLVASIPIADTPLRVGLTFLPDRNEILVAADGLTSDGVHDHELWLMPSDGEGTPRSLGIVEPGQQIRVSLDADLVPTMQNGALILLSREPLGGAPDKSAPGPVVAQGELHTI